MAFLRTTRAGSIAARLGALVLVPIATISFLAAATIERYEANAKTAGALAEEAELRQAAASVVSPAQLEQIALEGLARIDELGVPRDSVVELSNVDFERVYRENLEKLDQVLDELETSHGDQVLADGTVLSSRISFFRGSLETQRSLSENRRSSREDVRDVFVSLEQMLDEQLLSSVPDHGSIPFAAEEQRHRLTALQNIQRQAGIRGAALLTELTSREAASSGGINIASALLDEAIADYRADLAPQQQADFDVVLETLVPIPPELTELEPNDGTATDAKLVRVAADAVLHHLSFLDALEAYSADAHEMVAAEFQVQAALAEQDARRTTQIVIGLIALTLMLAILISASMLAPLRRLRVRAGQFADGQLDGRPLPVRGPSDIRTLTVSMNSMLTTLQALDREVNALASGRPVDAAELDLPGEIGDSLRRSLHHLDKVTQQLHTSEQLASAIVEQAVDGIWTIDAHGRIASANAASESILGLSPAAQIGRPINDFLSALNGNVAIERTNASPARYLVASSAISGGSQPLTAVIARNISEHLQFEERLAYQAHHDALTGLPNRYALLDHMDGHSADRLAVLFVDLDGFKTVNDLQGHQAGDAVLEQIARRLESRIGESDFVGRIGGDEFVVTMRSFVNVDDVVAFGHQLIREIELPYSNGSHAFTISASVGIAVLEDGLTAAGVDALEAIQRADSAVYLAKRSGRRRVEVFDNELQSAMVRSADLEMALRSAASSDQLELHLQPIMNLKTGEFTSAEALVRWNRPGVGLVPPGEFIPVAERSGLIYEIERWVLKEACTTLARWRQLDPFCMSKIAVNVSGRHLLEGNLLIDLRGALRATGADPRLLEIELTETQLLDDLERATKILDAVRAQGITVAIDDFGTGYSSMAYLHQLPIDTLKIDREFVTGITDTRYDSGVLDALFTIAKTLKVSVVAEGIETVTQLEHVRQLNCDRGQGYLLARPVPVDEAEAVMGIGLAARPQFDIETMRLMSRSVSAL